MPRFCLREPFGLGGARPCVGTSMDADKRARSPLDFKEELRCDPRLGRQDEWESARKGRFPGYHVLRRCELPEISTDFMLVDLRQVYSLPVALVRRLAAERNPRLRLPPPYREHHSLRLLGSSGALGSRWMCRRSQSGERSQAEVPSIMTRAPYLPTGAEEEDGYEVPRANIEWPTKRPDSVISARIRSTSVSVDRPPSSLAAPKKMASRLEWHPSNLSHKRCRFSTGWHRSHVHRTGLEISKPFATNDFGPPGQRESPRNTVLVGEPSDFPRNRPTHKMSAPKRRHPC